MLNKLRRLFAVLSVATIALMTPLMASPAEAASYRWVYIVFPSWQGNCPLAKTYGIQASVSNIWSTNWDYGDDIVYGKVKLNSNQSLSYNLQCKRGSRVTGYQAGSATIKPRSDTRTIFVGPNGVQYQNY